MEVPTSVGTPKPLLPLPSLLLTPTEKCCILESVYAAHVVTENWNLQVCLQLTNNPTYILNVDIIYTRHG